VLTGQVTVGMRADGSRVLEPRVFAVCFDSERIFVYDPARRRLETEIATGRGPHAIAIDPEHGLLYVAHFTDSYIGVVSIDRRHPMTYGKTLASIGQPTPPRTSK
jgi:DNA-binding beta-propeller fold protein YncE